MNPKPTKEDFATRPSWFCRRGWHRNIIREHRRYSRCVSEYGETVDAESEKECACGVIIRNMQHSNSAERVTVSRAEPVEV